MKKTNVIRASDAGFTLIELLVVITILGILMSMAVGASGSIKYQAQLTQAKSDCIGMVTATKAFYSDYSRYPIPASKTDDFPYEPVHTPDGNKEVMDVLTGVDTAVNPRGTVYYEAKSGKLGSGGYPMGGLYKGGMFDPWGSTYGILVDGDYDGKLTYVGAALTPASLTPEQKLVSGGAGVYSIGSPKKKPMKAVLSWE